MSPRPIACLGRRYRLSASHRLARADWSQARNQEVFGKCANTFGHGHNYTVEVVVQGQVDCVTGMVLDLAVLDAAVAREVLEPFDHCDLNRQPAFADRIPTSENLCMEIHQRLLRALPEGMLRTVRVEETANNFFSYGRGALAPTGDDKADA